MIMRLLVFFTSQCEGCLVPQCYSRYVRFNYFVCYSKAFCIGTSSYSIVDVVVEKISFYIDFVYTILLISFNIGYGEVECVFIHDSLR